MSLLKIQNISKSFGDKLIISKLSLEAQSGERILISGNNGIGKSTLLKIIGGHLIADSGEIMVDSTNAKKLNFIQIKEKVILISASEDILYPRITGLENILYFSKLLKLSSDIVLKRIEQWKSNKLFSESLKSPFYDCSQGMKRVLSLFVLTMGNPKIILLDECFKSFDSLNRAEILSLLNQEFEKSLIIMCTHHREEFESFKKFELNGELLAN